MKPVNLALRGLQFLCILLVLALVGNMIAGNGSGDPSIVNYCMFAAVFGMLSMIYLIAGTINESFAGNPIFMVAADAINTLVFFCGATALAAQLDVHSCGNQDYVKANKVTKGDLSHPTKRCREAQAVCAFMWFAFAAFAGSTVLSLLGMKGSGAPRPSIIRRGGPSMSQV